jgi:DNA invertase Pin-like site-specific DNA recombinase
MQSRALREYAARRGWTIAVQVREVGSGVATREAREKLLEAARRRQIDVVLVWRLDRWGRSVTDLLATLQELEHLGVGFVSPTEALDLTTPAGRAMAGLLAIFAEFEREILRERTRAGLAQARLNGKRLGRPATVRYTPPRSENYIALASPKLRSPVGSGLDALQYAEFWVIPPRNRSAYIPYTGSPKGHRERRDSAPTNCLASGRITTPSFL